MKTLRIIFSLWKRKLSAKYIISKLYERHVDELYFPKKVEFIVRKKGCFANVPEDAIQVIASRGNRYHEKYFWDKLNCEITIFEKK